MTEIEREILETEATITFNESMLELHLTNFRQVSDEIKELQIKLKKLKKSLDKED